MEEQPVVPSGTVVCRFADVADGAAAVVVLGSWQQGGELIVARSGERVFGYVNVCAHQSLPLNVDRLRFSNELLLCDHHAAAFRFSDGLCVAGVCEGRSLRAVALRVIGDVVVVR